MIELAFAHTIKRTLMRQHQSSAVTPQEERWLISTIY